MAVNWRPDGYPTLSPYLMVKDAPRFVEFMTTVFGAQVREQLVRPDGSLGHTELALDDALIMLSEAVAPQAATPMMLHVYVPDVDAAYERALRAGAEALAPVTDQFYGDRSGGVKEPCGNTIWIATHIEDVPPQELKRRAAEAMRAKG